MRNSMRLSMLGNSYSYGYAPTYARPNGRGYVSGLGADEVKSDTTKAEAFATVTESIANLAAAVSKGIVDYKTAENQAKALGGQQGVNQLRSSLGMPEVIQGAIPWVIGGAVVVVGLVIVSQATGRRRRRRK